MIEVYIDQRTDAFRDENAALQWAIETFRNNASALKGGGSKKERLAYNKTLLLHLKRCVETIQHNGAPAMVVPESYETLHRIDNEELLDLIRDAGEAKETREYMLAVAAALIENENRLPDPLKKFVIEILRNLQEPSPGPGRKRSNLVERDSIIGFVVASICVRWKFSPTRNEATERASAISIAQKALGQLGTDLTEGAISKIWDKSCWKQISSIE